MRVAIYQTNPILLDLKANLEEVIEKIHEGKGKGAELIVFPELALTGYFLGQRYHEVALRMDSEEIQRVGAATRGSAAVVGFVEESPSMNFYNSALVAVDGEVVFSYRKLNLPNYGVFEERKYFSSGKHVPVFKYRGFVIAVFICNDLWHPSLPYLGVSQKADLFITIMNSAEESMGSEFSNMQTWEIINTFYSRIFGIYNICANRVGEERFQVTNGTPGISRSGKKDGTGFETNFREMAYRFWGGSEVVNPFGKQIEKAALYEPDQITADISRELLRKKKILLPYLRDDDPHFTHRELDRILYGRSRLHPDRPITREVTLLERTSEEPSERPYLARKVVTGRG
jgi:predicted amidohydrolase